jgi:hypothetical protein
MGVLPPFNPFYPRLGKDLFGVILLIDKSVIAFHDHRGEMMQVLEVIAS